MFIEELLEDSYHDLAAKKRLRKVLNDIPSAKFQLQEGATLVDVANYVADRMADVLDALYDGCHLFEALGKAGVSHAWLPAPIWPTLCRLDRHERSGVELADALRAELA